MKKNLFSHIIKVLIITHSLSHSCVDNRTHKYFLTIIIVGCWNAAFGEHSLIIKMALHVLCCWQQAFMCMCTEALTTADKINGVTRESISTVNRAPMTARGNHLLLQSNSLLRNAPPSSFGKMFIHQIKWHVATSSFYESSRLEKHCFALDLMTTLRVLLPLDWCICCMTSIHQIFTLIQVKF